MGINKREFLKLGGLAIVGVSAAPAIRALAQAEPLVAAPVAAPAPSPAPAAAVGKKRMAMAINAKVCPADCRDCIQACHTVHNVPNFVTNPDPAVNNPRHEIKWIWGEEFKHAFPGQEAQYVGGLQERRVLVLCNHCDNPPCVRVCPTKATFRRPDGIVMMDYHRCIGCRFCVAACPFGARSFNWRDPRPAFSPGGKFSPPTPDYPTRTKGVVEKCTFCVERLAQGQKPACVEACKSGGLIFGDLEDPQSEIRQALGAAFSVRRRAELGTLPMVYYLA